MVFAGQLLTAGMFPPAELAVNTTTMQDFSSTNFAAPPSPVEVTFVAPLSGKVVIYMQVSIDADNPNEEAKWDCEVREVNGAGPIVHSPSVTDGGGGEFFFNPDFPSFTSHLAMRPLIEPLAVLTPLQTYWAQLQWDTDGTTMDINYQSLLAQPFVS